MRVRPLFGILAFLLLISLILTPVVFAGETWIFEEETEFMISGVKDSPIFFTAEMVEEQMNVEKGSLEGLTITSLPKASQGLLVLDTHLLQEYQQLSREDISHIRFVPVYGSGQASFTFIPQTKEAVKTTVVINLLDNPNSPPIVSGGNYATMKNMGLTGYIRATDPENDELSVKLISGPEKGTVSFTGTAFTYTPYTGKTGEDSFTFCVMDNYGNYSQEATMDITIEKDKDTATFADMNNNAYHYSAIKSHQAGLVSGEQIGSIKLFYPETEVKQGDFLIMLTAAAGFEQDLATCINTGLSNDSSFKLWTKPYIDLGIQKGIIGDNYFEYDTVLTRAQAVEMVNSALGMEDVRADTLYIKDLTNIPESSLQSYLNLNAYGLLNLYDGNAYPNAPLTRDFATDLVYALYRVKN